MSDYRLNRPAQADNYGLEQEFLEHLKSRGVTGFRNLTDTQEDLQGADIEVNGVMYDLKVNRSDTLSLTVFRKSRTGEWYCPLLKAPEVKYMYARRRLLEGKLSYAIWVFSKQDVLEHIGKYAEIPMKDPESSRWKSLDGHATGGVPNVVIQISELLASKIIYFTDIDEDLKKLFKEDKQ